MADDSHEMSMSLPLDSEGFLRRECPTCEREFKWLADQASGVEPTLSDEADPSHLWCPYCGVEAPSNAWWTKDQLEEMKAHVMRQVMGPAVEKLQRTAQRASRNSFVKMDVEWEAPDEPVSSMDDDGQRTVTAPCHPEEPVKVDESWTSRTYCLVCGESVVGPPAQSD